MEAPTRETGTSGRGQNRREAPILPLRPPKFPEPYARHAHTAPPPYSGWIFLCFSCFPSKARGPVHSKTRLFPAFQFRIQLRGCAGLGSHTADPLDLKFSNDTSVKFGKIIVFFFLIFGPGYLVAVNRIERLRTRIWGDVPSTLYRSLNAFSKVLFRCLFGSYNGKIRRTGAFPFLGTAFPFLGTAFPFLGTAFRAKMAILGTVFEPKMPELLQALKRISFVRGKW